MQIRSQLWTLRTLKRPFYWLKNTKRKMRRVPAHLHEHALGMLQGGMRTADVVRAINCNVRTVRCLRRDRQRDRTDSWSSSQWQTTCNNTGSVHPNSTPAGQVQDGNNNCPSYTRNAQSLPQIKSHLFIKPFLHQLISQSVVQKPSLKPQTATNAGVEALHQCSDCPQ